MEKLIKPRHYHALSVSETLETLKVSEKGLSDFEAKGRRDEYGDNSLPSGQSFSYLRLFIRQFNSPLMYIVLAASLASFIGGHPADAVFILFVILINTTVGFIQESKAEKALEKLKKAVKFTTRVIREGKKKALASEELVPGDIIELQSGDKVPADGRIISHHNLRVNEAMLTGEWMAVQKQSEKIGSDVGMSDRVNMVFMGTMVEEGKASVVITDTGVRTELGKISQMVQQEKETKTPLQKKFLRLSKLIGIVIVFAIILFASVSLARGGDPYEVFITSIALVVSSIPAGLLPAITVILILGMRRLARKKALVRKLNSNEAMGSVTVICMDKTGTLTQGEMQVSHILAGDHELYDHGQEKIKIGADPVPSLEGHVRALEIATLVNDAFIENPDDEFSRWVVRGRPTDRALLTAGLQAGIERDKIEKEMALIGEVLFDSALKYAARVYQFPNDKVAIYVLGSPEEVVKRITSVDLHSSKKVHISSREGGEFLSKADDLSSQGLRVLACAWKIMDREEYEKEVRGDEKKIALGLTLVGFIALKDPLRPEVAESIRIAQKAGIRPIIITGDHKKTTQSIMKELDFEVEDRQMIEGFELEKMSEDELDRRLGEARIFARVLPEHKIRIVRALQKRGEVVAMVGDGVNDAPALKASDIGISVGSGTDIAKEVSDIVLLDDSFSVIVNAIEQGRLIYENIRRVIIYLIADDLSQLFVFFFTILLGMPFPLYPVQILWINLVEDGFPDIALTTEKDARGLMDEKPRDPKEPIFNSGYKKFILTVFFVSGIAASAAFLLFWLTTGDIDYTRTAVFALVAFDSLVFAYIVRSFKESVFHGRIFSNKILNGAVLISAAILILGIYLPIMQKFLHTVPLGVRTWSVVLGISFTELILLEVAKRLFIIRQKA